MSTWSRVRRTAVAAALATGLAAVAACGGGTAGPRADGGNLALWTLQNEGLNVVQQEAVDRYNGDGGAQIDLTTYLNDPYKAALQTAVGSPNGPDIFYNWGGGNLRGYVEAGQTADLTAALDADPAVKDAFLPQVLETGTIDGQVHAVPMQGMQPLSFFYNKDVFAEAGITGFPATWQEFLSTVDRLRDSGVQPIALAGAQAWTSMMYPEYLLDRVGGPEKFEAIAAGEPGAWQDPAVVEAMTMVQDLVDRGAFGTNFTAVDYDNNASQALLTSGRAAMELMGSWQVTSLNDNFPDFLEQDKLGWAPFPAVEGGAGDPGNVIGNPSNYYSVAAGSSDVDAATDFLLTQMTDPQYVQGMLENGQVPAVNGISDQVGSVGDFTAFNVYTYEQTQNAPTFIQSWDQALPAAEAQTMLTNLSKVFTKELSPEQFAEAMDSASR
ncbi:extracellular solute-binding protein [Pseudonocardia nematodicida]|uniref:Extracellular solute-binding protein n=1 Tax=Pseudonocardia nematodicida TaxID=1206997 RepID=A0ABV1K3W4_9PSEU